VCLIQAVVPLTAALFPSDGGNEGKYGDAVERVLTGRLIHRVEAIADREGEFLRVIRFLEVIEAAAQDKIFTDDVRAVTAGKNHFEAWPLQP